jgi:hypothetical protein
MDQVKESIVSVRRDKTLVGNLAYLLAEPFGVQDPEIISKVTSITSYFDTFTHLIDDATDEKKFSKRSSGLIHLGIDNFVEGTNEGLQIASHPEWFFLKLQQYWNEASKGEKYLWKHHSNLATYEKEDFDMLGKRGSMAKVPIALYADLFDKKDLVDALESGLENAAIAVQLFDDIFDWKEDLKNEIYTHPIALAYNKVKQLDHKSIEKGLFCNNAFNDSVNEAMKYLEKGKNLFCISEAYQLASMLEDFTKNALYLNENAKQLESRYGQSDLTEDIKKLAHPLLLCH